MVHYLSCRAVGGSGQKRKPPKLRADGRFKGVDFTLDGSIAQALPVQGVDPALQFSTQSFLCSTWYLPRHPLRQLHHKGPLPSEREADDICASS
jgi:hypothetical protein